MALTPTASSFFLPNENREGILNFVETVRIYPEFNQFGQKK